MARANMTDMIAYLRQHGQAAAADIFLGVTYWTADQLEEILDRNSYYFKAVRVLVTSDELIVKARLAQHHYPDVDTVIWYNGTLVATPSATYNFERNLWVLSAKTTMTHVEAAYVNMWEALADLWGQKAAQRWQYVNFKAGNNRSDLEQEYLHCIARQSYYRSRVARRFKRN